ncbi:MAG: 4Fe-4S dicluster domain-containing protein [Parachlamydiales bacterium]|jgi:ferredoxin
MSKRKIIEIDRDKCNGCGLCTTACAEGALILDKENKAVLVKEIFCDGLGACLDVCPVDALHIVEKDAPEYNSAEAYKHVLKIRGKEAASNVHGAEKIAKLPPLACGCPGSAAREIKRKKTIPADLKDNAAVQGELTQWPIQLHLISPYAPYFNECDLLISSDCTAFTLGNFHNELLKGKKIAIACPKLDDTSPYVAKLAELLKNNIIFSLTVAIMSVPCCSSLYKIVQQAVIESGKNIAIKKIVINLEGEII